MSGSTLIENLFDCKIPRNDGKPEVVGVGGFAVVIKIKDNITPGEIVLKLIPCMGNAQRKAAYQERILEHLPPHKNTLRLLRFKETPASQLGDFFEEIVQVSRGCHAKFPENFNPEFHKNEEAVVCGAVYERVGEHDLFDWFMDGAANNVILKRLVTEDLVLGLAHIHHSCIAHRDIKLENTMVRRDSSNLSFVIIDFGLAVRANEATFVKGACGTGPYMAPELHSGKVCELVDLVDCRLCS